MLPDLQGRSVVDLGCGFGWFCRWAREAGAARVLGLDVSENMLARAREMTPDKAISYERADLERLTLPAGAFDLAYSSLALHYIEGLKPLLENVLRALVPGGRLGERDALVFGASAHELDAPSALQVDRGGGDHATSLASATQFAMMRRPGAELFSGWNWSPQVFALRTAAAKRRPSYSDQAIASRSSSGTHTYELA
jgi:SAM-dependent methyltransferase